MTNFIKKLAEIYNNALIKYGIDKVLHGVIAAWLVALASPLGLFWMGAVYVITIILSILKEKYADDVFTFADIIATAKGGAISLLIYIPISLLSNIL